jgi:hypothetical protein
VRTADNLTTFLCPLSSLNLLEPYGPVQACNGRTSLGDLELVLTTLYKCQKCSNVRLEDSFRNFAWCCVATTMQKALININDKTYVKAVSKMYVVQFSSYAILCYGRCIYFHTLARFYGERFSMAFIRDGVGVHKQIQPP